MATTSSSPEPTAPAKNAFVSPRILLSGCVLISLLLGAVVVIMNQQSQLSLLKSQINLDSIERQALERALQSESLLSEKTISMLREALRGGHTNAIAMLTSPAETSATIEVIVIWSDDYGAGQWIWLSSKNPPPQFAVFGRRADSASDIEIHLIPHENERVIGLRMEGPTLSLHEIQAQITVSEAGGSHRELAAVFLR